MANRTRWLCADDFAIEIRRAVPRPCETQVIEMEVNLDAIKDATVFEAHISPVVESDSALLSPKWYGQMGTVYFALEYLSIQRKSGRTDEIACFHLPFDISSGTSDWENLRSFLLLPDQLSRRPLISVSHRANVSQRYSVYRLDNRNFWFAVYDTEKEEDAVDLLNFLRTEGFEGEYQVAESESDDLICHILAKDDSDVKRIGTYSSLGVTLALACDASLVEKRPIEVRCEAKNNSRRYSVELGSVVSKVAPIGF